MAIPANKEELIAAITINYKKLRIELERTDRRNTRVPAMAGHARGTTMSVNNLVSYLIGWGQLVLKWNRKRGNNEHIHFPEDGYKWNELGKLAQKFYDDFDDKEFDDLLSLLDKTVNDVLMLVEQKTNHELYQTDWHDQWPLGRLIQFNTSSPYQNALARVRKWKKDQTN